MPYVDNSFSKHIDICNLKYTYNEMFKNKINDIFADNIDINTLQNEIKQFYLNYKIKLRNEIQKIIKEKFC